MRPFGDVPRAVRRVALLSVHTCPLDQPGTGDSGGMNVYVRSIARRLAEMGVAVDIFSRWSGKGERVFDVDPGVRVVHLGAGPDRPIPKEDLAAHLPEFLYALLNFEATEAARLGTDAPTYDIVHSNYWLSGWVGRLAAERWRRPLVHSFHTLARIKNATLAPGDVPESAARVAAEDRIAQTAECVLAPTIDEASELVRLLGARPERVRIVPPGVDTDEFRPDASDSTTGALGLDGRPVVLFVGRLQPLKSPETAVRALAAIRKARDAVLVIAGGPSGSAGITGDGLMRLARDLGVGDRVLVRGPIPHGELPGYYRAADAVVVPSRSESFGLVALEAAACGTPVVATDVGGLRTTVRDGITGRLVGPDPAEFASALDEILSDRARATEMGAAGACFARRYDWRCAAASLVAVYEELAGGVRESRGASSARGDA